MDIEEAVMKKYTWEEKIESLVTLAKAAGRSLDAEPGTDYAREAREKLLRAYDAFCDWRHEEPYVVDEIKAFFRYLNLVEPIVDYLRKAGCLVTVVPELLLIKMRAPKSGFYQKAWAIDSFEMAQAVSIDQFLTQADLIIAQLRHAVEGEGAAT